MSNFSEQLSKALKYHKSNWEAFQQLLTENPEHRWGGEGADKLIEVGRMDEQGNPLPYLDNDPHFQNLIHHLRTASVEEEDKRPTWGTKQ